jgi:hypothetical protein
MNFFNSKTVSLIIPILLVVLFYLIKSIYNSIQQRRAEELFGNYHKDRIIYFSKKVNFFGLSSTGLTQIRGNGSLLLKWLPKSELIIPLTNIESIERVNSFLGKKRGKNKELLKIDFFNQQGELDSAALLLDNLSVWEEVLQASLK